PRTVVCPSLTRTVVFARCVLIDGTPLNDGPTEPLSTVIFRITVLAAVIWGVTFKTSAASLKLVVTVLFVTVWYGTWTPWATSASTLFCVETLGVERRRALPVLSAAESATSRLNAPLTDPSANPTALVAATPRFTAVGCAGVFPAPPCVTPTRP